MLSGFTAHVINGKDSIEMTVNNPGPVFRKLYKLANRLSVPRKSNTSQVLDRLLKNCGADYLYDVINESRNLEKRTASIERELSSERWNAKLRASAFEKEIAELSGKSQS